MFLQKLLGSHIHEFVWWHCSISITTMQFRWARDEWVLGLVKLSNPKGSANWSGRRRHFLARFSRSLIYSKSIKNIILIYQQSNVKWNEMKWTNKCTTENELTFHIQLTTSSQTNEKHVVHNRWLSHSLIFPNYIINLRLYPLPLFFIQEIIHIY